jgi:hypothetical protein
LSERATQHHQAQQNFRGLGDDAFLAGPVHRLGDDLADVGVGVGGETTSLEDVSVTSIADRALMGL